MEWSRGVEWSGVWSGVEFEFWSQLNQKNALFCIDLYYDKITYFQSILFI